MCHASTTWLGRTFAALVTAGFVPLVATAADGQLSYEELAKMAQAALDNGEVAVDEPMISVEDGFLNYYLGGAGYILDPNGPDMEPFDFPLRSQFQVAVIRKYRSTPKNRNFWDPVLARVGGVIAQQLEVVQSQNLSGQQKLAQLGDLDSKIGQIYDAAMQRHAQARGLRAFPAHPYIRPFQVRLVSVPPGAEIYLLHAVENRLAQAAGKKSPWHRVEDPSNVELRGKYWYLLKWAGQTRISRQPFEVTRDGTITLR
jgi:hypothetical protein